MYPAELTKLTISNAEYPAGKTMLMSAYADASAQVCHRSVFYAGSRDGTVTSEISYLSPVWPKFDSRTRHHTLRSFSLQWFSSFPLSSNTNVSKFQFNLKSKGHRSVSCNRL